MLLLEKSLAAAQKKDTHPGVLSFLFSFHSRHLSEIRLLYLEVQNKQEGSDGCQNVQTNYKDLARQKRPQQIEQGEDQRAGGHRQTAVEFVAAGFHLLALGLLHIEESQTDHGADTVAAENCDTQGGIYTHAHPAAFSHNRIYPLPIHEYTHSGSVPSI